MSVSRRRERPPSLDLPPFSWDVVEDVDEDDDDNRPPAVLPNVRVLRVLGSGTFNCAHLTSRGDVMRVALLHRFNGLVALNELRRGAAILELMQGDRRHLGPALLRTTGPFLELSAQEFPARDQLCEDIQKTRIANEADRVYCLQYIEFCSGGSIAAPPSPYTEDDLMFLAFSLLWFVYVAGAEYGFNHNDLKGDNVLLRYQQGAAKRVFFEHGDLGVYTFTTRYEAVVVDYDMGSVATTADPRPIGTYWAAAPEALFGVAFGIFTPPRQIDLRARNYWSVGIVILEACLAHHPLYSLFRSHIIRLRQFIFADLGRSLVADSERIVESYLLATFFIAMVHGDPDMAEPQHNGYPASGLPMDALYHPAVHKFVSDEPFVVLVKHVHGRIPAPLRSVLQRLLSWDPRRRYYSDSFAEFARYASSPTPPPPVAAYALDTYAYPANQPFRTDATGVGLLRLPHLKGCADCRAPLAIGQAAYACACCGALYCGENCHAKNHQRQK
jgi:hypothetical protein